VRTKSLHSVMRKLLRLDDLTAARRSRADLHDLLGLRVIVEPRQGLDAASAEDAAVAACYRLQALAHGMWAPLPGRSKDYVAAPKPNGYQSLHSTVWLCSGSPAAGGGGSGTVTLSSWEDEDTVERSGGSGGPGSAGSSNSGGGGSSFAAFSGRWAAGEGPGIGVAPPTAACAAPAFEAGEARGDPFSVEASLLCRVELQVRTAAMHAAAERGDAAHAGYKGGIDRRQVRKLQAWTAALQQRLAGKRQLQLPASRGLSPQLLLPAPGQLAGAATVATEPSAPAAAAVPLPAALSSVEDEGAARAAAALFDLLDSDGDGALSLEELSELIQQLQGPEGATARAASLLAALDTDGDGRVSRTEFARLWRLQAHGERYAGSRTPSSSNSSSSSSSRGNLIGSLADKSRSQLVEPSVPSQRRAPRTRRALPRSKAAALAGSGVHASLSLCGGIAAARRSAWPILAASSIPRASSSSMSSSSSRTPLRHAVAGRRSLAPGGHRCRSVACGAAAGLGHGAAGPLDCSTTDGEGAGAVVGKQQAQPEQQQQQPVRRRQRGMWGEDQQQQKQQQQQQQERPGMWGAGVSPEDAEAPWQGRPRRPAAAGGQQQQQQRVELRRVLGVIEAERSTRWDEGVLPEAQPDLQLIICGAPCEHRATQKQLVG
jgi:hypothetical protein